MIFTAQLAQFGRSIFPAIIAAAFVYETTALAQSFPAGTQNFSNTTNANLTDSGSAIQCTITTTGTVWIAAGYGGRLSTAAAAFCAVNDGTSDYDVGGFFFTTSTDDQVSSGDLIITGLAPGTYTFTLRCRVSTGTLTFDSNHHAWIRAMNISNTNVGGIIRINAGGYNITATTNTDLLDQTGGNTYPVTLTKRTSASDLYAFLTAASANSLTNASQIVVAGNGTIDADAFVNRSFTTSSRRAACVGTAKLSGYGAGSQTVKMRVRSVGGAGNQWQPGAGANRQYSSMVLAEVGPGSLNAAAITNTPASNVGYNSLTYTDALNASGGSALSITLNKRNANSKILLRGSASALGGTTLVMAMGARVAGTDYDLTRIRTTTAIHRAMIGERIISGVGAGLQTITARLKTSNATGFTVGAGTNSVCLSAIEIAA